MAKYSYEFKKKIVQEYLAGNGGATYLANKYNIPHVAIRDYSVRDKTIIILLNINFIW